MDPRDLQARKQALEQRLQELVQQTQQQQAVIQQAQNMLQQIRDEAMRITGQIQLIDEYLRGPAPSGDADRSRVVAPPLVPPAPGTRQ